MEHGRDDVLGNRVARSASTSASIGSGAGGGSAAAILTAAGSERARARGRATIRTPGLDRPLLPFPTHSNDELKYAVRRYLEPQGLLEPRTFRTDASAVAAIHPDVNLLPKAVGGAFQHADCKTPRFNDVDFRLQERGRGARRAHARARRARLRRRRRQRQLRRLALLVRGARAVLRRGRAALRRAGRGRQSLRIAAQRPYPMPPGVPMYLGLLLAEGARRTSFAGGALHPHTFPAAINSRPYGGRPAVRRLRLLQRLRLPEPRQGLAGRDDAAQGAPDRPLPAPLQRQRRASRERRRPRERRRVLRRRAARCAARPPTRFVLAASPIESARLLLPLARRRRAERSATRATRSAAT